MAKEFFDLLDENGALTGNTKLRSQVHKDGDWHRTVHVWFLNSKRELLIQKRLDTKKSYPGLWDISAAGHIEAGDGSIDSAIKEVREELGVNVLPGELEFLFTIKGKSVTNNGTFVDSEFNDVYLVNKDVDLSSYQIQPEEVAAVKYVDYLELESAIRNNQIDFVPNNEELDRLFGLLKKRFSG